MHNKSVRFPAAPGIRAQSARLRGDARLVGAVSGVFAALLRRSIAPRFAWIFAACMQVLLPAASASLAEKTVLVHYMPWHVSKSVAGRWGWHWTMGHFDPDRIEWDGKRNAASPDYPLLGLYDSTDDAALECHVLWMKAAGIDGVILDWYGTLDHHDYARNHAGAQKLVPWLKKAGLRFALCYEDKALENWARATQSSPAEISVQALRDLQWAEQHWFSDPAYVREDARPLLLVFGPQALAEGAWAKIHASLPSRPLLYALPHLSGKHRADGVFAWPPVTGGKTLAAAQWRGALSSVYQATANGDRVIATAFPGFRDMYAQAGVRESYGTIPARNGATWRESLEQAAQSSARVVQIATWNDFGEGTMIEPTRNQGFRALETLRAQRPQTAAGAADLQLPLSLYHLRKRSVREPAVHADLDKAAALLFAREYRKADALLTQVATRLGRGPAVFGETPEAQEEDYRLLSDVAYHEAEGVNDAMRQRCRLDAYFPAHRKDFSTVIWFHGGGLSAGGRSIPLGLRRRGMGVVAVDYRLTPENRSPAFLEDAAAALAWTIRHIGEYGGSSRKVFVSGHSAGAYLSLMLGLDKRWLAPHGLEPRAIAGLVPLSPQTITHFAIREERGIPEKQPVVDDMAPLFHVSKDAPPCLIVTGDREKELFGRYEENAYFWRMMKLTGHADVTLQELQGFDHGRMAEPALPLVVRFVESHSAGSGSKAAP